MARADRPALPRLGTKSWDLRWRELEPPATVGQKVDGFVIARTPFGVRVEAGLDTPALLLVPYMAAGRSRPLDAEEYPAQGSRPGSERSG